MQHIHPPQTHTCNTRTARHPRTSLRLCLSLARMSSAAFRACQWCWCLGVGWGQRVTRGSVACFGKEAQVSTAGSSSGGGRDVRPCWLAARRERRHSQTKSLCSSSDTTQRLVWRLGPRSQHSMMMASTHTAHDPHVKTHQTPTHLWREPNPVDAVVVGQHLVAQVIGVTQQLHERIRDCVSGGRVRGRRSVSGCVSLFACSVEATNTPIVLPVGLLLLCWLLKDIHTFVHVLCCERQQLSAVC